MEKQKEFPILLTVSLIFILLYAWLNKSYFAGVMNITIIGTLFGTFIFIELRFKNKYFKKRLNQIALSGLVVLLIVIFILILAPRYTYQQAQAILSEQLAKDHHSVILLPQDEYRYPLSLFKSMSLLVDFSYTINVKVDGRKRTYLFNPLTKEILETLSPP